MTKVTAHYGLIGYPLSHSFSPAYFNNKFAVLDIDAAYTAYPLENIALFPQWLKNNPSVKGLNVTIPYKEAVIPYLHEVDEVARVIGAVNCIDIRNGVLKGYNTDVLGFERSLLPLLHSQHTNALVLGTGGGAKAVAYVLSQSGIAYTYVSRNRGEGTIAYDDLNEDIITAHPLIINTTPLGMYPRINECPAIPYNLLTAEHLLYDLIYNPAETKFLSLGKAKGTAIKNGQEMLILQAEASWEIWSTK